MSEKKKAGVLLGLVLSFVFLLSSCGQNTAFDGGLRDEGEGTGTASLVSGQAVSGDSVDALAQGESMGERYDVCNDRNLYVEGWRKGKATIEQRMLTGELVETYPLDDASMSMVYVNNDEILLENWRDSEKMKLFSIPIHHGADRDTLLPEKMREVLTYRYKDESSFGLGNLYADKDYVVLISTDHDFQVYDRQRNKFIKIENETSASAGFFNDTLFTSGARVGKCFVYVTKPDANEKYGLHIYQLGQNTVKNVDDRCVRAAAGTTWPAGGKVLYDAPERADTEGWMMGSDDDNPWHIYTYDVNTGEREVFLSHREIEEFCEEAGLEDFWPDELQVDGDRLYLISYGIDRICVLRCNLEGKPELHYERKVSESVKYDRLGGGLKNGCLLAFLEGKCVFQDDYDDEKGAEYILMDPDSGVKKKIGENDPEQIYLWLLGLSCDE